MKRLSTALCLPLLLSLPAFAACGADDGSAGDDDVGGADAAPTQPDASPDEAPVLLSSSPQSGAVGVEADVAIVLEFSQPMDAASVEGAMLATTLGDISIVWNQEQTVLTITPMKPLEYAEGFGDDPSQVTARYYEVVIGTAAHSAAGVNLEQGISVSFTTLKRMSTTVAIDPALTRSVSANGTMNAQGADLRVGDLAANVGTRALVTFDLSVLPATATAVESATLATRQIDTFGNPYTIDPQVNAYHVSFDALVPGYSVFAHSSAGMFSQFDTVTIELDVTDKLDSDLQQRAARGDRSQFRLQFDSDHNNDSNLDYAEYSLGTFEIALTYLSE